MDGRRGPVGPHSTPLESIDMTRISQCLCEHLCVRLKSISSAAQRISIPLLPLFRSASTTFLKMLEFFLGGGGVIGSVFFSAILSSLEPDLNWGDGKESEQDAEREKDKSDPEHRSFAIYPGLRGIEQNNLGVDQPKKCRALVQSVQIGLTRSALILVPAVGTRTMTPAAALRSAAATASKTHAL
jgi:hypothetical protein